MRPAADEPREPTPEEASREDARERHARLRELFARARDGSEADVVAQVHAEDPTLGRELEELLAAARASAGFLERPALGPEAASAILDGPEAQELAAEELGEIGGFRPLEVLGRGGGAVVFRAWQKNPSRFVALKVLDASLADERARRRFEVEAEILARLSHPDIAQIHEAGAAEVCGRRLFWFAMELVPDAVDLRTWCDTRRLPLSERVALVARVCDAVNHGHQRGVVHRDLKPQNVLVDPEGRPRVIDFGVARLTDSDMTLTTRCTDSRAILGTLAYMSPEQCEGDPNAVDLRSDVWSMGAILFELVCGRRPFSLAGLSLPAALRLVAEGEIPAPRAVCHDVPRALEAVMLKALAGEPERRYASMSELAADLRRFIAGEPVLARPPSLFERAVRTLRRRPVASSAAASLGIAALVLVSTWLSVRWLALQPRHIEVLPERSGISLVSRLGQRLFTIDGGAPFSVTWARVVRRPERLGGDQALAIAFSGTARDPELAGRLALYEAHEPYGLLWTSDVDPLALPAALPPGVTGAFEIGCVLLADVLPEEEGDEIVATHDFVPFSPTAIRVWDLEGRVRYEAWHDGGIPTMTWLEDSRRLVLAGLNSEKRWDQRGACDAQELRSNFATVVFALEPRDGHRSRDWVVTEGERLDETLRWYHWIGPTDAVLSLGESSTAVDLATGAFDPRSHLRFSFVASPEPGSNKLAGLHLVLDADGNERGRYTDDGWKVRAAAGGLVDAGALRLLEYEDLPR